VEGISAAPRGISSTIHAQYMYLDGKFLQRVAWAAGMCPEPRSRGTIR
jgi:hypothetical protein